MPAAPSGSNSPAAAAHAASAPGHDAGARAASPATSVADAGHSADAGSAAAAPSAPPDFAHTFPDLTVGAGAELIGTCQSWTLGNDQPVYVNRVVSSNDGGFHHSNWIWVDDTSYDGPDGTWQCADRGFDQILAGAVGGVFFAQSTQARHDTQAFPEGVAFEMPAHARIIGDVHLLNAGDTAVTTRLGFELYTLPANAVRVQLQPMAFTNTALDIAASTDTSARMECATPQPDFDIYYVLPHYHVMGLGMRIDVMGGPMDRTNVFSAMGGFGMSVGQTFDPPIAVHGADGLAITCDYRNPRASTVGYGEGDQEMCVTLIYSSGAKAGGTAIDNFSTLDDGGVHRTDALCVSVGSP
jgi:hypothetical protein